MSIQFLQHQFEFLLVSFALLMPQCLLTVAVHVKPLTPPEMSSPKSSKTKVTRRPEKGGHVHPYIIIYNLLAEMGKDISFPYNLYTK